MITCINCNNKNALDSKFCKYCGNDFGGATEELTNINLKVGRADTNDIVFEDDTISSIHAIIYYENGRYYIQDNNSSNGTYIDGRKIYGKTQFDPDRPVSLGTHEIILTKDLLRQILSVYSSSPPQGIKSIDKILKEIKIGRNYPCNYLIDNNVVSGIHASLYKTEKGWYAKDLNSTNGTYLNHLGNRIPSDSYIPVKENDIILFGTYRALIKEIINSENKKTNIKKESRIISIGRDPNCNIQIQDFQVEMKHAQFISEGDNLYIEDLGSQNGTFVNGARIKKKQITKGDMISIGSRDFLLGINYELNPIKRTGMLISVDDLRFTIGQNIHIISGISFTVYPSELIGIMGPSGCGKTTLLECLCGEKSPSDGIVDIDNLNIKDNINRIKLLMGYVPQDDIMHRELTVYEVLYYTAKLRLAKGITKSEIDKKIETVLRELGLRIGEKNDKDIRKDKIGSPEDKTISGGERRRVSIAMELLHDPRVLYLDEPTSGLSSYDSVMVIKLLKDLSNKSKTVVLTIHQPSLKIYKMLNNVIILENRKLAFYGPSYPDSIAFFNPEKKTNFHPDELLDGMEKNKSKIKNQNWNALYSKSDYHKKFVSERKKYNDERKQQIKSSKSKKRKRVGLISQIYTLTERYSKILSRDKLNFLFLIIQAPIISLAIIGVFTKLSQTPANIPTLQTVLFLLVIAGFWLGLSNSAKEIIKEKAIYIRERRYGLAIFSYIFSKYLIISMLSLVQSILLTVPVYFIIDIKDQISLFSLLMIIWLISITGISIGLLISAIVTNFKSAKVDAASSLLPIIMFVMIIFSGGIQPIYHFRLIGGSSSAVEQKSNEDFLQEREIERVFGKFRLEQFDIELNRPAAKFSIICPTRWSYEHLLWIINDYESRDGYSIEKINNYSNKYFTILGIFNLISIIGIFYFMKKM